MVQRRSSTKSNRRVKTGPRKALSAYLLFSMARRGEILKDKPHLKSNVTEISKIIGAEWRQLSADDKKPYMLKHEEDKERYNKEKQEFDKQSNSKKKVEGHKSPAKRLKRNSSKSSSSLSPSSASESLEVADDEIIEDDVVEDNVAEDDVAEDDIAEDDVAEDDVAEDDVAEDDVAEDDIAQDDVAEHDITANRNPEKDGIANEKIEEKQFKSDIALEAQSQIENSEITSAEEECKKDSVVHVTLQDNVRIAVETNMSDGDIHQGKVMDPESGISASPVANDINESESLKNAMEVSDALPDAETVASQTKSMSKLAEHQAHPNDENQENIMPTEI